MNKNSPSELTQTESVYLSAAKDANRTNLYCLAVLACGNFNHIQSYRYIFHSARGNVSEYDGLLYHVRIAYRDISH